MSLVLNKNFSELSLEEMQEIDGDDFYDVFIRGCELLFVGTCTAIGGTIGSAAGPAGTVGGGAVGALAGEVAWENMFGNSMAGNVLI